MEHKNNYTDESKQLVSFIVYLIENYTVYRNTFMLNYSMFFDQGSRGENGPTGAVGFAGPPVCVL